MLICLWVSVYQFPLIIVPSAEEFGLKKENWINCLLVEGLVSIPNIPVDQGVSLNQWSGNIQAMIIIIMIMTITRNNIKKDHFLMISSDYQFLFSPGNLQSESFNELSLVLGPTWMVVHTRGILRIRYSSRWSTRSWGIIYGNVLVSNRRVSWKIFQKLRLVCLLYLCQIGFNHFIYTWI